MEILSRGSNYGIAVKMGKVEGVATNDTSFGGGSSERDGGQAE